jgi:hypothetical protein
MTAIRAGRLRRWYRAKSHTKRVHRERLDQATGRVTYPCHLLLQFFRSGSEEAIDVFLRCFDVNGGR